MAARAIWKGSISLGRTKLPIKLYSAVEGRGLHFNLLEKKTHKRVRQHMVNPSTGEEVPHEEITKGYEIEPDTFVLVEEEELEKLEPEPSTDVEIIGFLPEGRIGQQYFDAPYYLGPDGDAKSYFALAEALENKRREGLTRWVMRKKDYIGALCARDGYLMLITLRFAEEVLTARQLGPPPGKAPDQREVKMAEQLVSVLQGDFRAQDYTDQYHEKVLKYIEAKAKGRKPKLAALPKRRSEPKSLMAALNASLKSLSSKEKEKKVA